MENTLELISYNLNGIRSAVSKGLANWIKETNFDIYLFQETKAHEYDIPKELFEELGYHVYLHSAQKKGYSGVAILTKLKPDFVNNGIGIKKYDDEGRLIRMDIGDITIINSYFPSGSSGEERQSIKMNYLDDFFTYIHELRQNRQKIIISGDYNICHQAIDIHDPVGNKNNSGFLPEERAWMSKYFDSGFIDTFRHFNAEIKHEYSWWSFRANARNNNKGWRIDYNVVTNELKPQLLDAKIFQEVKHSDHCPVYLKIKR